MRAEAIGSARGLQARVDGLQLGVVLVDGAAADVLVLNHCC